MAKDKTSLKSKLVVVEPVQLPPNQSVNIKSTIGFQLTKILKLKRRFIDLQMKKLGLSRTQWQVLFWMKILGPCLQKELLKNIDIDAAHLARILEEFEKNNYIVRARLKNDRRALFIQLTDYSKRRVIPHLKTTIEKENSILMDGLNIRDKKCLNKILQKLTANMESVLNNNDGYKNGK